MTYPHPEVRAELAWWLQRRADIVKDRALAATFEVVAVPTAVLVNPEGRILDRVVGFLEPGDFRERLAKVRVGR